MRSVWVCVFATLVLSTCSRGLSVINPYLLQTFHAERWLVLNASRLIP